MPSLRPAAPAALILLLARALGGQVAPSSPADAEPREIVLKPVAKAPVIDGVLDDDAWQSPPLKLGTWLTYNPLFGERLKQETEVWMTYDRDHIYFAFRCLDPEPGKIKTSVSRRDTIWNDDWVGLSLDSIGNHQTSYDMFVNPNGIQADILNSSTAGESTAPDWVWDSAGKRTDFGYTAEIRLSLKSIRFRSGTEVRMGVLFWRRISRLGMSASWPGLPPGKSIFTRHTPVLLGDLKEPLKLELIPNLTYSWNQDRQAPANWGAGDATPDAGLTLKYGITSSVTLDGTFRPDFSQVESDAYQVEVNRRYPIFYSEKRPFFMEGMGTFELAGTGGDGNMTTAVHTRRIIDPLFGAKLTGTAGGFNFATLTASDQAPGRGDVPATLAGKDKIFNIARAVYPLKNGSYAGGLLVDTEFGPDFNRVAAGDFSLRFKENHRWSGTLIGSQSRSVDAPDRTFGMAAQSTYGYNSKRYGANIQLEHYDTDFRMDTAFFNRTGYTGGNAYFGRSFYPDAKRHPWLKRVEPFVFFTGGRDRPQGGNEALGVAAVRLSLTRQGFLRFDVVGGKLPWKNRELPLRTTRAFGGAQLYRWLNLDGRAEYSWRAPYYDSEVPFAGHERQYSLNVNFQPNGKLSQQVSYTRDAFDKLDGGPVYAVNIVNTKTTYQFTRHLSVRAIARYDSLEKRVLTDLLGAFELVPGTVAYAGYGGICERRGWDGSDWLPGQGSYYNTRRGFFFKLSYLYRL